ncbi:MAG: Uma2 family endonuclease [Janthinobacterium lividum]
MLPVEFEEATILRGPFVASFSEEEFFRFCQENDAMRVERTADHEIIIMPPAGFDSGYSSGQAYGSLYMWQYQYNLGLIVDSSTGYTLPDGAMLSPDASWVSPERLATVTDSELKVFPRLCPDFVIEVKSPSDRIKTLQAKMEQWLKNGVRLGFLLDTETTTAYVYRPGQPIEEIQGFDGELSGESVLPGYRLDLRRLRRQRQG